MPVQFSTLFLISLFSVSIALSGCVGSDNSSAPTKPNQPTNPETNNPNDNTDDDNSSGGDGDNGGNDSGGSSGGDNNGGNDGSGGNGTGSTEPDDNDSNDPSISYCELPSDSVISNIFKGIGTKDAYTLGAPNNYTEETSGDDLTGTWVVVSKTNEQQDDYSQIFYSKSFFVIKKDSDGNYKAANCRAQASKQPTYTEQWFDKNNNPVKAHCYDYYKKDENNDYVLDDTGNKEIQNITPESCKSINENNGIELLNIDNPEAHSSKQVETGTTLTPWSDFITATYDEQNETLSLPIPNPVDRTSNKENIVFNITSLTSSSLEYSSSQETKSHKFDSNYEAYKVSNNTGPLGTSYVTFLPETQSEGEPIYCFTQQYKIENDNFCQVTNKVPGFTVITDAYKYSFDAMQSEINALVLSTFTEVNTDENTDTWVGEINHSNNSKFEANEITLDEMSFFKFNDDSKEVIYKFDVNVPDVATTP